MVTYLRRLFAHLQWSDERALRSIHESQHLPARALELFAHVLAAEHVWLSRIHGRATTLAIWPSLSIAECDKLAGENHAAFGMRLDSLDDDGLRRVVPYRNPAGAAFARRGA